MNLNAPATARLTPPDAEMPPDLAPVRVEISRGLPQPLDIAPGGLRVVLSVATGLVRPLLTLPPETLVLSSDDQRLPAAGSGDVAGALADSRSRAALRLLFISGGRFAAVSPLVTGTRILIPGARQVASAAAEIWIRSFTLTVSALVGKGATGSRVEFGWRALGRGSDSFDSAVLRPALRGSVAYSRRRDGVDQIVPVDAELLSPDAGATAAAGGLNWRLMHDRL